jgi:hypothetical protein
MERVDIRRVKIILAVKNERLNLHSERIHLKSIEHLRLIIILRNRPKKHIINKAILKTKIEWLERITVFEIVKNLDKTSPNQYIRNLLTCYQEINRLLTDKRVYTTALKAV